MIPRIHFNAVLIKDLHIYFTHWNLGSNNFIIIIVDEQWMKNDECSITLFMENIYGPGICKYNQIFIKLSSCEITIK